MEFPPEISLDSFNLAEQLSFIYDWMDEDWTWTIDTFTRFFVFFATHKLSLHFSDKELAVLRQIGQLTVIGLPKKINQKHWVRW